jgi:ribosomal-protein-alanine N-acetyltransferase
MLIQTPRLLLRELELADVVRLNEIQRDARVARYMNYEPRSLEQTQVYVDAAMQSRNDSPRAVYDLAISEQGSDLLIGRCGFGIRRPEHREAMIWYELHPDQWGRGYATEAAAALIDLAFRSLGVHRIWADCDPRNEASCRVAERLGMLLEGRLRENYWLKGEWCSTAVYGLLEHEWRARLASSAG